MTVATRTDEQIYVITAEQIATFNRSTGEPDNITTQANSLIALNYVQPAIHAAVNNQSHTFMAQSLKFRHPVFVGDTLHIAVNVNEEQYNRVNVVAAVYNQDGVVVLDCETTVALN